MTRHDDELADTIQAERLKRGLRAAAPMPPAPQTGEATPRATGGDLQRAAARKPCPYCGRLTKGRACRAHHDLTYIDPRYA